MRLAYKKLHFPPYRALEKNLHKFFLGSISLRNRFYIYIFLSFNYCSSTRNHITSFLLINFGTFSASRLQKAKSTDGARSALLGAGCWTWLQSGMGAESRGCSLALATPAGCVSGAERPGAAPAARTPHELTRERQRAVPLESEGAAAACETLTQSLVR